MPKLVATPPSSQGRTTKPAPGSSAGLNAHTTTLSASTDSELPVEALSGPAWLRGSATACSGFWCARLVRIASAPSNAEATPRSA